MIEEEPLANLKKDESVISEKTASNYDSDQLKHLNHTHSALIPEVELDESGEEGE